MPRVTYVKRAQARYGTKPVIDPETGQQARTPMMRNGQQIVTKRGPKWLRLTEVDKSKPLPNRKCDKCGTEILPGQPYKWIKPKSGPYGGSKRVRCGSCPTWQVWEYSSSLDARLAEISYNATQDSDSWETEDDVQSALDDISSQIEELASEWNEKAQAVEDGFGHSTYVSEELAEKGEAMEQWASEISCTAIPDLPEPEEEECEECDGRGEIDNPDYDSERVEGGESYDPEEEYDEDETTECEVCGGTGRITPEDPTDEQMDAWREEAVEAVESAMEQPF